MDDQINISSLALTDENCLDSDNLRLFTSKSSFRRETTAMSKLRHKLANRRSINSLSHSFPSVVDDDAFQRKVKALIANPAIFHDFKQRLAESGAEFHAKEGFIIFLHDFLEKRITHDDLQQLQQEQENTEPTQNVRFPRLNRLSSYLNEKTSPRVDSCGAEHIIPYQEPFVFMFESAQILDRVAEKANTDCGSTSEETSSTKSS